MAHTNHGPTFLSVQFIVKTQYKDVNNIYTHIIDLLSILFICFACFVLSTFTTVITSNMK